MKLLLVAFGLLAANLNAGPVPSDYTDLQIAMENAGGNPSGSFAVKPSGVGQGADVSHFASQKEKAKDSKKPETNKETQKDKNQRGGFWRILEKIGFATMIAGAAGGALSFVAAGVMGFLSQVQALHVAFPHWLIGCFAGFWLLAAVGFVLGYIAQEKLEKQK